MLVPDYSYIQICFLTTGLQSSTHLSETTHLTPPSAPASFNQLLSFQTQETNKRNSRKIKTPGLMETSWSVLGTVRWSKCIGGAQCSVREDSAVYHLELRL